jgi:hypothetical protein
MPRKAGPPKRSVLIRILETTAQEIESKLPEGESLSGYVSKMVEREAFVPKHHAPKSLERQDVSPILKGAKK